MTTGNILIDRNKTISKRTDMNKNIDFYTRRQRARPQGQVEVEGRNLNSPNLNRKND
jgi:hypothetical protein